MEITPEIRALLKRVVWDYAVDEDELCSIFEGKTSSFSLNKDKLSARLLLSTKWYTLLDLFGIEGVKDLLTDEAIQWIWIKDVRERFIYVRSVLNGRKTA